MSLSPGTRENAINTTNLGDVIPLGSSMDNLEEPTTRNEKRQSSASMLDHPKSHSLSSFTTVESNAHETHHHEHGDVRTLPRKLNTQLYY
jgi:hypothetical protein